MAKPVVKDRVAPDSDIAKLAAGIIKHAEAAKASGRKLRGVLHGDEKLESRFWLQLVALLADKCPLTAIKRVDLVCGSGESSHRLSLYGPKKARGFHIGEWNIEL